MVETSTGTQQSDPNFVLAEDAAAVVPAESSTEARFKRQNFINVLSGLDTAVWAEATSGHVDVQSTTLEPEEGGMFVSPRESRFLVEIRRELGELTEPVRSSPSARLCERFVQGVGMALANQPSVRWAIFADEEDGVTLIAHSRASKRQISFEFAPAGESMTVVQIDEEMRQSKHECGIHHELQLANAIEWLRPVNVGRIGALSVIRDEGQVISPLAGRDHALSPRGERPAESPTPMSAEQWIAELRAWIASHPRLPYEADDSRESIYEGRGE